MNELLKENGFPELPLQKYLNSLNQKYLDENKVLPDHFCEEPELVKIETFPGGDDAWHRMEVNHPTQHSPPPQNKEVQRIAGGEVIRQVVKFFVVVSV